MEPEISTKMLRNLNEKLRAELPATTHGNCMVKFLRLEDAFSEILNLEVSPVESQSLQQEYNKRRKRKGHFLVQILISAQARANMF